MGTVGSYSGGGGKPGRDLREDVNYWLDSLPDSPPPDDQPTELPTIPPETVLNVIPMFRSRGGGTSDGPGGMGGRSGGGRRDGVRGGSSRGGAQRSASRSASTAGRAAAAAYALRTGDVETLRQLGLDYNELRSTQDPIEVTRRIVEAACGPLSDGTIEDEERRYVAAEIAQWVLEENEAGAPPEPEEIVREAIARIIFEAATTETAAELRNGSRPAWATREGERQIRESADALAQRAELSPAGPTVEEFERAVEQGIEALRNIFGGTS